jgi:hypothetical protein
LSSSSQRTGINGNCLAAISCKLLKGATSVRRAIDLEGHGFGAHSCESRLGVVDQRALQHEDQGAEPDIE